MFRIKIFAILVALCALAAESFATVDPLSGTYSSEATDLILQFRSLRIGITRNYNSVLSSARSIRPGKWFFRPFEKKIFISKDNAKLFLQDGVNIIMYQKSERVDVYLSVEKERIVFKNGSYVRSLKNGTQEVFDGDGKLTGIQYPDGNTLAFEYFKGKLEKVLSTDRELLRYYYNSEGLVEQIKSFTGTSCYYSYNDAGLLVEAVNEQNLRTRYEYDIKRRMSGVRFQTGDFVNITYYPEGGIVKSTEGVDGKTSYAYKRDKAGNIIKIMVTGPLGAETLAVKNNGKVVIHTDFARGLTEYHTNDAGLPILYVDAIGNRLELRYDSLSRLIEITNPDSSKIRHFYLDDTALIREKVFADGSSQEFVYNDKRQVIKVIGPGNSEIAYQYNKMGLVDTEFYGRGGRYYKKYTYNDAGALEKETDSLNRTTAYRRDSRGRITEITDPLGRIIKYQYNQHGQLVRTSVSNRMISSRTYDESLRLVQTRDVAGLSTHYTYDDRGNLKSVIYPNGHKNDYTYNKLGQLSSVSTSPKRRISYKYNKLGLIIEEISPNQTAMQLRYDPNGNLIEETDFYGHVTKWAYDSMGRVITIARPDGIRNDYIYDRAGRVVAEKDAGGNLKNYRYDVSGNLVAVMLPNGDETVYAYNPQGFGNMVSAQTTDGRLYRNEYDAAGRLTREEMPWGEVKSYTYDKGDRLIRKTSLTKTGVQKKPGWKKAINLFSGKKSSSKGLNVSYQYDEFDRVTTLQTSDGNAGSFVYDEKGNIVEVRSNDFRKKLQYNRFGELISEEYPMLGKIVKYSWDEAGNRTALEVPRYLNIRYSYDNLNRLSGIEYEPGKKIRIFYDQMDRKKEIVYPNGVRIRYVYNKNSQIETITYLDKTGKSIDNLQYTFNKTQKLQRVADSKQNTWHYEYDTNGQLIWASSKDQETIFEYGPSFQRVAEKKGSKQKMFRYNKAGQMVEADHAKISYDASGNISSKTSEDSNLIFQFDALGRLSHVKSPAGDVSYVYSPEGERVSKTVGGQKRHYVYDGLDLLMELYENGEPSKIFIHGDDIDSPLVMLKGGKSYFYLTDYLGSVIGLTDENGKVVTEYRYDPFGKIMTTGKDTKNPFTFTARFYDQETGLYYYRARYYDPDLGIFLSPDPKEKVLPQPEDYSPYHYAANDPINFTDPLGLSYMIDLEWYWEIGVTPEIMERLRQYVTYVIPWKRAGVNLTGELAKRTHDVMFLADLYAPTASAARKLEIAQKIHAGTYKTTGARSVLVRGGRASVRKPSIFTRLYEFISPSTGRRIISSGGSGSQSTTFLTKLKGFGRTAGRWAKKWTGPLISGGITGYFVGTEYARRANAEGRRVNWTDALKSGAESAIRAPLEVLTIGTLRFWEELTYFGFADRNVSKGLQRLAHVQQLAKGKDEKGKNRLEKLIEEADKREEEAENLRKNQKAEIKKAGEMKNKANESEKAVEKYELLVKTQKRCERCRKQVEALEKIKKQKDELLTSLMDAHKTAKNLANSVCNQPAAPNTKDNLKAAEKAADEARNYSKELKRLAAEVEKIEPQYKECAKQINEMLETLESEGIDVREPAKALGEMGKKIKTYADKAWKARASAKEAAVQCEKLRKFFQFGIYEATRKHTDKTVKNLMAIERWCKETSTHAIDAELIARDTDFIVDNLNSRISKVLAELKTYKLCDIRLSKESVVEDINSAVETANELSQETAQFVAKAERCAAFVSKVNIKSIKPLVSNMAELNVRWDEFHKAHVANAPKPLKINAGKTVTLNLEFVVFGPPMGQVRVEIEPSVIGWLHYSDKKPPPMPLSPIRRTIRFGRNEDQKVERAAMTFSIPYPSCRVRYVFGEFTSAHVLRFDISVDGGKSKSIMITDAFTVLGPGTDFNGTGDLGFCVKRPEKDLVRESVARTFYTYKLGGGNLKVTLQPISGKGAPRSKILSAPCPGRILSGKDVLGVEVHPYEFLKIPLGRYRVVAEIQDKDFQGAKTGSTVVTLCRWNPKDRYAGGWVAEIELGEFKKEEKPSFAKAKPKDRKKRCGPEAWYVHVKVDDMHDRGITGARVFTSDGTMSAREEGGGKYLLGPIKNIDDISSKTIVVMADISSKLPGFSPLMGREPKTVALEDKAHVNVIFKFQDYEEGKTDGVGAFGGGGSSTPSRVPRKPDRSEREGSDDGSQPSWAGGKKGGGTGKKTETRSGIDTDKKDDDQSKKKEQRKGPKRSYEDCAKELCPMCSFAFGKRLDSNALGGKDPCDLCLEQKAAEIKQCMEGY